MLPCSLTAILHRMSSPSPYTAIFSHCHSLPHVSPHVSAVSICSHILSLPFPVVCLRRLHMLPYSLTAILRRMSPPSPYAAMFSHCHSPPHVSAVSICCHVLLMPFPVAYLHCLHASRYAAMFSYCHSPSHFSAVSISYHVLSLRFSVACLRRLHRLP